ncbi:hypothetical protein V5799_028956 [Amblyomma americanum]|uniref:Uncharacterized protein n=1 Tax=Amblyomma americanum TaxID=6943 RepID=A0AAQ4DBD7_AMBAM
MSSDAHPVQAHDVNQRQVLAVKDPKGQFYGGGTPTQSQSTGKSKEGQPPTVLSVAACSCELKDQQHVHVALTSPCVMPRTTDASTQTYTGSLCKENTQDHAGGRSGRQELSKLKEPSVYQKRRNNSGSNENPLKTSAATLQFRSGIPTPSKKKPLIKGTEQERGSHVEAPDDGRSGALFKQNMMERLAKANDILREMLAEPPSSTSIISAAPKTVQPCPVKNSEFSTAASRSTPIRETSVRPKNADRKEIPKTQKQCPSESTSLFIDAGQYIATDELWSINKTIKSQWKKARAKIHEDASETYNKFLLDSCEHMSKLTGATRESERLKVVKARKELLASMKKEVHIACGAFEEWRTHYLQDELQKCCTALERGGHSFVLAAVLYEEAFKALRDKEARTHSHVSTLWMELIKVEKMNQDFFSYFINI